MKRVSRYILLCAFLISFALPGWGATYPVTKSGNGADEAISSITVNNQACTTLSAVVTNAQEGDTIEVGAGTYTLSTSSLKPTKKNITLKTTAGAILSGNSTRRVIYLTNGSEGFTLDGFTIKDGNAGTNYAGGVMVYNTTATLRNCTFTNNKAEYGAGVAAYVSGTTGKLTVDNCTFTGNVAGNGTTSGYGGGMIGWLYGSNAELELIITNSTFSDVNKAGGPGGAININAGTSCSNATLKTTIENCVFDGNVAGTGAAIEHEIYGSTTFGLKISNCLFNNNVTTSTYYGGGGVFVRTDNNNSYNIAIDDEIGYVIENCTFTGNKAHRGGGLRILNLKSGLTPLQVRNCTFNANETNYTPNSGGALYNIGYSTVTNCTFMGNKTSNTNKWGADVFNTYSSSGNETKLELINSIFGSGEKSLCNDTENDDNKPAGAFNLTSCAYVENALVSTTNDKKGMKSNNCFTTEATDASKKWAVSDLTENKDVEINGVKHTVYKITNASSNLIEGGIPGDTVPEKDILGYKRDTEAPSIGAVEYIEGISITTDTTLTPGTYNTAYSAELKAEFNPAQDDVTYVWSLESGTLPDGLSLDVTGKITGTPSKTGTFTFKAKVTDDTNELYATYSQTRDFTLKINPPTVTLTPATATLKEGTANEEYSDTLTTYFTAKPDLFTGHEYTWSVANLPTGLTFDAATKTISGKTLEAGTLSFDVTVTAPEAAGSGTATARATVKMAAAATIDLSDSEATSLEDVLNSMSPEAKEAVTEIIIPVTMTTLEGLEDLVNLASLDIAKCVSLETVDLSKMSNLTNVKADGCTSLTTVTVANNTSIQTLSLKDCGSLESLILNGCLGLTDLDCSNTAAGKIAEIDLTGCASLTNLDCSSNEIAELDVTDCVSLDKLVCNGNGIGNLVGLENCKDLTELHCENNSITDALDKLECENLEVLVCGGNSISSMSNISKFKKLKRFECHKNQITALQILRSIFTQLEKLSCKGQVAKGLKSTQRSDGNYAIDMSIYTTAGKMAEAGISLMAADVNTASDYSGFYASDVGEVTSVKAYDEKGNLLENLSTEAGSYVYASQPTKITYDYDTGYGTNDGIMDVEISGTDANKYNSGSNNGSSGGGCDTGISGLAVLIAAALALKKRKA